MQPTRYKNIEFEDNLFFNDLTGTIVEGEIIVIAGAPGSNKSTKTRQLVLDRALRGIRTLMVLTEEPVERARSGFVAMASDLPPSKVRAALSNIHVETGIQDVAMLPNFFAQQVLNPHGLYHGVEMIVLDSIQGPGLSANDFESYQALIQFFSLREHAGADVRRLPRHQAGRDRWAKGFGTRSGLLNPDPKSLQPTNGVGVEEPFRSRDSPTDAVGDRSRHAQTACFTTYRDVDGGGPGLSPRAGLTEVQGAVALPKPGSAAKVTAPGLPRKEIEQYVAGLCQVPGFELADFDLSIQCRVPGERRYRSVLGLPLSLALAASYIQQPIPERQLHIGEIDLCRNVREVPSALLNDLTNSITNGEINLPVRILCPLSAVAQLPSGNGVEVVPCRKLDDAIFSTWPNLR